MSKYAVYGTLRQGSGNHGLLSTSDRIWEGNINIPFDMRAVGGFPALTPTKENNDIFVEVYEVNNPNTERSIDGLEGYPGWYDKIKVDTPKGEAFIYVMNEESYKELPLVESGDWHKRSTSNVY